MRLALCVSEPAWVSAGRVIRCPSAAG